MSKYNSFAFLTCALPSQVGNWVHMQPEVWNRAKTRLICHFYLAQILCALCANFSLQYPVSNPRIAQNFRYCSTRNCSAHCVPFPILQYLALVRALYAYSRVVVPGIEERGECKNFSTAQSCGSFRDSKPTFFRHFKELTLHQQALSVRWSLAKNYRQSMFVNFARNFFRGLESVLAHSSKMLFRKITP